MTRMAASTPRATWGETCCAGAAIRSGKPAEARHLATELREHQAALRAANLQLAAHSISVSRWGRPEPYSEIRRLRRRTVR